MGGRCAVANVARVCVLFFFQAEDGIRDIGVTGVQTCALPILVVDHVAGDAGARARFLERSALDGLLLALSVGGGATGARRFPLLVTDSDWDTATDRLGAFIPALEDTQLLRLLASLVAAVLAPSRSA